ncbi:hypothetical protein T4C_6422 [Trichinella pseudospiralis]|uniref:Uncharacterized protein n=1 Tax=Trichinella pseudospiralis TaxID=6337 RepID=A0A0V1GJI0_TRIPS|nr:hypothetical protein T4C_6422 [Trichinella pseudospiralis]
MGSVSVKKALSKKVDKRPLRRMQRYMGSVSVHKALFKEVKERYFEEWALVPYLCRKHF